MLFSILVPFLNESAYLERCIESLLQQVDDGDDHELIFVDNGSDDGSAELVTAYPQIRILEERRQGPYLARNRGIEAATGDYVVLLDADCQPRPGWLAHYREAVEAQEPDVMIGDLLYPEPMSVALKCYQDYYNTKTGFLLRHGLRECYYGHAGNMAVRRSVFAEVGLFKGMPEVGDTAILHDLMAVRPDARIVHVPDAAVVHLEVSDFEKCLDKLTQCGEYTRSYETTHGFRTLTMMEKLRVMQSCARRNQYSLLQRIALARTLFQGWRAFEKGRAGFQKPDP